MWWFFIQIILTGTTIVLGLVAFRASTVDQALRARLFLPTPHHYHPADLVGIGRNTTTGWQEKLSHGGDSASKWLGDLPTGIGL